MKFYFVRHAPVIGQEGKVYGDDVDIDLDSHKKILQNLSRSLPKTKNTLWLHSGVDRTLKTGQAILNNRQEPYEIKKCEFFREQNFGDLIGQKHADIKDHLQWINGNMLAINPPNGETLENLKERVHHAIIHARNMAQNDNCDDVVIFCHRGTVRAAHLIFNDLPIDDFINIDVPTLTYTMYNYD